MLTEKILKQTKHVPENYLQLREWMNKTNNIKTTDGACGYSHPHA